MNDVTAIQPIGQREIASLQSDIEMSRQRLRGFVASWRAEHGSIMRGYWRGMARAEIKHIRVCQHNLSTWGVS